MKFFGTNVDFHCLKKILNEKFVYLVAANVSSRNVSKTIDVATTFRHTKITQLLMQLAFFTFHPKGYDFIIKNHSVCNLYLTLTMTVSL